MMHHKKAYFLPIRAFAFLMGPYPFMAFEQTIENLAVRNY